MFVPFFLSFFFVCLSVCLCLSVSVCLSICLPASLCAGAFHVKMRKASQKDKVYQCFYDPVEAGIYTVYVQWSGTHVEGSPFTVLLAHSAQELELMTDQSLSSPKSPPPETSNSSPRSVSQDPGFLY